MLRFLFLLVAVVIGCAEDICPTEDLSLAPRPYSREHFPVCKAPYTDYNCTCPSSMFECACHLSGKCNNEPGCIKLTDFKSVSTSCEDLSDIDSWHCPEPNFTCDCFNTWCHNSIGCLPLELKCNGIVECPDGSDEINCTCPWDYPFECDCYKTQNCWHRSCLKESKRCNGHDDCGDSSDEANCTCRSDQFKCHCLNSTTCPEWGLGCVNQHQLCDGRNDCGDWSDELNCECQEDFFQCPCYKTSNCTKFKCISKKRQCDYTMDCDDGSDEVNCTCPAGSIPCRCFYRKTCNGTNTCVARSKLCDGKKDCLTGYDETQYTCRCRGMYPRCPCDPNDQLCPREGRCLQHSWIGDGFEDCADGRDETCSVESILCQSCWLRVTTCTNEDHARNLVRTYNPVNCTTAVEKSCAFNSSSCETEKVTCVTAGCSNPPAICQTPFFCENQEVITSNYFCDGAAGDDNRHCTDLSDRIKQGFGFKCSGLSKQGVCVLPQANVYDSVAQCSDKSDLCFVNGQFRCFQCLDKKLIVSAKQVCDGIVDCFDMSDERLCANQELCDSIRGSCPQNQMQCHNRSHCVPVEGNLCNFSVTCLNDTNTKYCSYDVRASQRNCLLQKKFGVDVQLGGKCLTTTDEVASLARGFPLFRKAILNGETQERLLSLMCDGYTVDSLRTWGETNCPYNFYCLPQMDIIISENRVCDGIINCDNLSDEVLELCNKTRYYCKTKGRFSIYRNSLCDGIVDCDDGSDESRCRCEKERFYCTNKQPLSVEWKLVQNGIQDCLDGSDECVNLASDAFADVNEMIANVFYRVIFWTTGILAVGGNSFVFIATIVSLYKAKRNETNLINASVFILNLSFSDFLMGIYLLAVVVQATRFSGSYCLFDKEWRLSSFCLGLGAIAVVSCEASAFIMTTMTSYRLVCVFKPFYTQIIDYKWIAATQMLCWIMGIVLAIIPVLGITSGYFTTDVWFPNNLFGTDFVSRENMSLLAQRISGSNSESWNNVKQTISVTFPRNPIKGEFGYYGETSICMPRLFATTGDFAWEYSTFLITINFFMFIYMVVAYVLIYKQSNRMKGSRSTDVSSRMQKRISRLIVTDFCCWIPVCIMGYLSVGGVKMPPDAYVLSACLLLPINSALNPLLYSKVVEVQSKKAKDWSVRKLTSLRSSTFRSSDEGAHNVTSLEENNQAVETTAMR